MEDGEEEVLEKLLSALAGEVRFESVRVSPALPENLSGKRKYAPYRYNEKRRGYLMPGAAMPFELAEREFGPYTKQYSAGIITENEEKTAGYDYFRKSSAYMEEDCAGGKLDLTYLINKPDGYLQGKLSELWDADYYRFSVSEYKMLNAVSGKYSLNITITLDNIPAGCDYELILYDENGNQSGIGTDNGQGGKSITIPDWNINDRIYVVKVQARNGSPVNDKEYYHLSFRAEQTERKHTADTQREKMEKYEEEVRRKLCEGEDAVEEIKALRNIKEEYAAYYAEQMDKLHKEQAEKYLQGRKMPGREQLNKQIGRLLKKMASGEALTERQESLVNIFATAQEIDAAKAGAQMNRSLKKEIFSRLEEAGIRLPDGGVEADIGLDGKAVVSGIEEQAAKQTIENVLNHFTGKLLTIYFTVNDGVRRMSRQEQDVLRSAPDIEKFLQKATDGKVALADLTVENGRIKGLSGNLDLLINNPGGNRSCIDYRADILAIKNFERVQGSGLLKKFRAGYVISGTEIRMKEAASDDETQTEASGRREDGRV